MSLTEKDIGKIKTEQGWKFCITDILQLNNSQFRIDNEEHNLNLDITLTSHFNKGIRHYLIVIKVEDKMVDINYTTTYDLKYDNKSIEKFLSYIDSQFGLKIHIKKSSRKKVIYFSEFEEQDAVIFEIEDLISGRIIKDSFKCKDDEINEKFRDKTVETLAEFEELMSEFFGTYGYFITIKSV